MMAVSILTAACYPGRLPDPCLNTQSEDSPTVQLSSLKRRYEINGATRMDGCAVGWEQTIRRLDRYDLVMLLLIASLHPARILSEQRRALKRSRNHGASSPTRPHPLH